jgi:VanZ family protein
MLLVLGIIFFLSEQSGYTLSLHISLFYGADKIAHLLMYWVLAATVIYAFSESFKKRLPSVVVVLTVLFCLFYGISDEFHQSFTPGRSVSVFDVAADFTGALLCCIVWLWYRKRKKIPVRVVHCTLTG